MLAIPPLHHPIPFHPLLTSSPARWPHSVFAPESEINLAHITRQLPTWNGEFLKSLQYCRMFKLRFHHACEGKETDKKQPSRSRYRADVPRK